MKNVVHPLNERNFSVDLICKLIRKHARARTTINLFFFRNAEPCLIFDMDLNVAILILDHQIVNLVENHFYTRKSLLLLLYSDISVSSCYFINYFFY